MKVTTAQVYTGGGRRFLTLRAACHAEARAQVKKRRDEQGYGRGDEWPIALVARFARMLMRQHRQAAKTPP